MNIKTIVIGATLGAVFFATSALATIYECNVKANGFDGGIAPLLIFTINDAGTEASVYDGMIKKYHGKPIPAVVVKANAKRYTLKWTVDMVRDSENKPMPGINYRATYLRGNHKFTLTGFPIGYDNQFIGTGTCKRIK